MKTRILVALLLPLGLAASPATADDGYPTIDRVEFVLACMREGKGPAQELLYKCSCAIDGIAQRMSYQDYVENSTAAKAITIGGERGETMRAFTDGRKMAKRLRQVEAEARKACFLP